VRAWDACLYGGFTREASGHNPRNIQALRLKRRHEHKLLHFNNADIQDALCGCVGCGRCSDYCPVHIGTLEIVKAIAG
jgi:Fe-S oxidoreductase